MRSEGRALKSVRLYRHAAGFALEVDSRLLDLGEYLRRARIRPNLVDLFAEGWFTRGELDPRLESDDWRELGQLEGIKTPISPARVGKILALGKNFRAHAAEFSEEVPSEPLYFNKLPETLVPHGTSVRVRPSYTERVDHEAELAVLISRNGSDIAPEDALDHVAGYTIANDLTARALQARDRERGFPWFRAKNMDGFCPLGPALVPRDYFDVRSATVRAHVNGELRQEGKLSDMVVSVEQALAALSQHVTLRMGDLLLMGTPAGVSPLSDGDVVRCSIDGIGELTTNILR